MAKFIECYWFLQKGKESQSNSHPKLYPDPSAHIIVAAGHYQYDYTCVHTCFSGYGSHCIYPHRKTVVMDHSGAFAILGIKLKIGALYSTRWFVEKSELDTIADINTATLFGSASLNPEELIEQATANPESIRETFDDLLLSHLQNCREDRYSTLTGKALPLLTTTSIGDIGKVLNCSQRTLERSFLKVTGLTLKQCQSMIRFENILEYLYKLDTNEIDWQDIVSEFGFSDQPHLIRHLKSCIGATPTEYAKKRDLTIDIYGNFEFD